MEDNTVKSGFVKCPWCAEEILPEAKKCKHCGEFLSNDRPSLPVTEHLSSDLDQAKVQVPIIDQILALAALRDAGKMTNAEFEAARAPLLVIMQKNGQVTGIEIGIGTQSSSPSSTGTSGSRQRLSEVGARSNHGLACPNCGGTNFKPKRSKAGKIAVGVLAPKSELKCITCGAIFKRG